MKITEGCMAIVIDGLLKDKSPNIGKLVKVGKFIGSVSFLDFNDWWEVDQPISACNGTMIIYMQREHNLFPILEDGEKNENKTIKNKTRDKIKNTSCSSITRI